MIAGGASNAGTRSGSVYPIGQLAAVAFSYARFDAAISFPLRGRPIGYPEGNLGLSDLGGGAAPALGEVFLCHQCIQLGKLGFKFKKARCLFPIGKINLS